MQRRSQWSYGFDYSVRGEQSLVMCSHCVYTIGEHCANSVKGVLNRSKTGEEIYEWNDNNECGAYQRLHDLIPILTL